MSKNEASWHFGVPFPGEGSEKRKTKGKSVDGFMFQAEKTHRFLSFWPSTEFSILKREENMQ